MNRYQESRTLFYIRKYARHAGNTNIGWFWHSRTHLMHWQDGIGDEIEGSVDTDGDGQPDYLDTDSDNDGIRFLFLVILALQL